MHFWEKETHDAICIVTCKNVWNIQRGIFITIMKRRKQFSVYKFHFFNYVRENLKIHENPQSGYRSFRIVFHLFFFFFFFVSHCAQFCTFEFLNFKFKNAWKSHTHGFRIDFETHVPWYTPRERRLFYNIWKFLHAKMDVELNLLFFSRWAEYVSRG